jgi:hypothetical protein
MKAAKRSAHRERTRGYAWILLWYAVDPWLQTEVVKKVKRYVVSGGLTIGAHPAARSRTARRAAGRTVLDSCAESASVAFPSSEK